MSRATITAADFRASLQRETKRNKYGNRRTKVDGVSFASAGEARRWGELKLLERAGEISELRRQQPYPLKVNGRLVTTMVLDFVYRNRAGEPVYEDFKGHMTPEWALKAKLFLALTGKEIKLS